MLGLLLRVMLPFSLLLLLTHGFFNVAHVQRLTGLEALSVLWRVPAGLPIIGGVALSAEGLRYGVNVVAKSLTLLLLVPPLVLTTPIDALVRGLVALRAGDAAPARL
jgi:energy-coupling factor transport system permease protein